MSELINPNILNLNYDLRQEQERDLRRKIEENEGTLIVLVHPFYDDTIAEKGYPYPASSEYIQERDRLIATAITEEKPLVIFQDTPGELEIKTGNLGPGTLYVVGGAYSHNLKFWASHHVGNILENLGVKNIIIGGRILMYDDSPEALMELSELRELGKGKPHAMEWLSEDRLPYGCPMWVAEGFLQRGFDVSFSPICSPASLNHS